MAAFLVYGCGAGAPGLVSYISLAVMRKQACKAFVNATAEVMASALGGKAL